MLLGWVILFISYTSYTSCNNLSRTTCCAFITLSSAFPVALSVALSPIAYYRYSAYYSDCCAACKEQCKPEN